MESITFSNAPESHQTSGIDKSQWFDLFTSPEKIRLAELKKRIEDSSFMPAQLDAEIVVEGFTTTYRAVIRSYFEAWDSAPFISVKHPSIYPSLQLFESFGVLDDATRKDVIIKGVPL